MTERIVVTDPCAEIGLVGIMLGHFENGTGLDEAALYEQVLKLQRESEDD